MKKFLILLLAGGALAIAPHGFSADVKTQLNDLVEKVNAKLEAGKTSEQDLADELKGYDAILAQHKDEKTDDVAHVLFMKGALYLQVLEDVDKAIETLQSVKAQFPETADGKKVDELLPGLERQARADKIEKSLVEGSQFPDFNETDLNGKPLTLASYKGKLVLVDFWATWCGPCVAELPNVLTVYEKNHDKGFEVVGINLDDDKDAVTAFIQSKKIPWPQYFDGKAWESKLAMQYGITRIPATYLLDKDGKILAKGLRGDELEKAVSAALAAK